METSVCACKTRKDGFGESQIKSQTEESRACNGTGFADVADIDMNSNSNITQDIGISCPSAAAQVGQSEELYILVSQYDIQP